MIVVPAGMQVLVATGHRKAPCSRRFQNGTKPEPSHTRCLFLLTDASTSPHAAICAFSSGVQLRRQAEGASVVESGAPISRQGEVPTHRGGDWRGDGSGFARDGHGDSGDGASSAWHGTRKSFRKTEPAQASRTPTPQGHPDEGEEGTIFQRPRSTSFPPASTSPVGEGRRGLASSPLSRGSAGGGLTARRARRPCCSLAIALSRRATIDDSSTDLVVIASSWACGRMLTWCPITAAGDFPFSWERTSYRYVNLPSHTRPNPFIRRRFKCNVAYGCAGRGG
jgi:hypothetical protein